MTAANTAVPAGQFRIPEVYWDSRPARALVCPVCRDAGEKPFVLSADSNWGARARLDLHACVRCKARFFPDLEIPEYHSSDRFETALKFYLETGAGVDCLVEPFFVAPLPPGARCLDVGCGFGFAVDFAIRALGIGEACGIDPSPFAAAGKLQLGLPTILGYLTPETDLGDRTFDLAILSEAIEHVPDPHGFVGLIAARLTPDGILVLTTPDGESATPETPRGSLLPLLTAGWHFILHSAESLEMVLRAAGFRRVEIVRRAHSLLAVATNGEKPLNLPAPIDRALFQSYLAERRRTVEPGGWLADGLTYRLLKELANTAQYAAALDVFAELEESFASKYGIDLDTPDSIDIEGAGADSFDEFALKFPMNLCGVCYARGMIALNHEQDDAAAAEYFGLAERFGAAFRERLNRLGCDDGETQVFAERSAALRLRALASIAPSDAADQTLARLDRAKDGPETIRRHLRHAAVELFAHLVNLGALEPASRLAPEARALLSEGPGARPGDELRHNATRGLGLLALNFELDARKGAAYLALAERVARSWLAKAAADPERAGDALWRTRYERAFAWHVADDLDRALRLARRITSPSGGGDAIPAYVRRDAECLVQQLTKEQAEAARNKP